MKQEVNEKPVGVNSYVFPEHHIHSGTPSGTFFFDKQQHARLKQSNGPVIPHSRYSGFPCSLDLCARNTQKASMSKPMPNRTLCRINLRSIGIPQWALPVNIGSPKEFRIVSRS